MAALYGRLKGSRGEATRTGTVASGIAATLETWEGEVTTELEGDGTFRVMIGAKGSRGGAVILEGNVNTRSFRDPGIPVGYRDPEGDPAS